MRILRGRGLSLRTKVLAAILLAVVPPAGAILVFGFYVRSDERADMTLVDERDTRYEAASIANFAVQRALRSRSDIRLTTAMTGGEGLELLDDASLPDLVLLDVNLPDMTGMDILIRMRANVPTRDVPVSVLSADAMQDAR